jgi:hypothetical protein
MKDSKLLGELDERDLQVARHIHSMPDLAPPPELLTSVMGSVALKKLRLWHRILLWARSPRNITVTLCGDPRGFGSRGAPGARSDMDLGKMVSVPCLCRTQTPGCGV